MALALAQVAGGGSWSGALLGGLALGRRVDANLHRALGYTLAIHLPIAALGLVPLL